LPIFQTRGSLLLEKGNRDLKANGSVLMSQLAPPAPPQRIGIDDHDGTPKLRLQLLQVWLTLVTILITVWLITLGPIPAIIGIVTAKHVLVAILVMGLGVDSPMKSDKRSIWES
jgi:hypothetical protein